VFEGLDLRTTRTIHSAIEIRAPIDVVWHVLTDFDAYPDWNPHIRRVQGELAEGRRVMIQTRPPGGRLIVMHPTILTWSPPNELSWRATFLSRHMFSGEHRFRLDATAHDRVRFVQDETFSGLLVPIYSSIRLGRTRTGFELVGQALRERAENEAGP